MRCIFTACVLVALGCFVVFASVESKALNQTTWKTFSLSHVTGPTFRRNPYRAWDTQKWFRWLNRRDRILKAYCPECQSLLKKDSNTFFVASRRSIWHAFSRSNKTAGDRGAYWSTRPFQTYALLNNSAYNCGRLYFSAQLNDKGLPVDLIGLGNTTRRSNLTDFSVNRNCRHIRDKISTPKLENDDFEAANADVAVGDNIQEFIPENDYPGHAPENDFPADVKEEEFLGEFPGDDFVGEFPESDAIQEEDTEPDSNGDGARQPVRPCTPPFVPCGPPFRRCRPVRPCQPPPFVKPN